jgi:mannose-6-phosphate isomerase-like protein (cupin superfamily)
MSQYIPFVKVSLDKVPVYTPPGHDNTYNRRIIGPENGARHMELIFGEMRLSAHAELHSHHELEQSMFILEGEIEVTGGDGARVFLRPGDTIFFPVGCEHKVTCMSEKSKFLVISSPPRHK